MHVTLRDNLFWLIKQSRSVSYVLMISVWKKLMIPLSRKRKEEIRWINNFRHKIKTTFYSDYSIWYFVFRGCFLASLSFARILVLLLFGIIFFSRFPFSVPFSILKRGSLFYWRHPPSRGVLIRNKQAFSCSEGQN